MQKLSILSKRFINIKMHTYWIKVYKQTNQKYKQNDNKNSNPSDAHMNFQHTAAVINSKTKF